MIRSAILFMIIALITGVTGFGIIRGGAAVIAQTISLFQSLCSWCHCFQAQGPLEA